jgi:hypothetical protein
MEEANIDFLKKLTTKQQSHNNHVNRSYLGVKGSKSTSNYKAVMMQNDKMKNDQVLQNAH